MTWNRLLIPLLLCVTGCSGPATGIVTGKVLFEGKPVPCGTVTFIGDDGRVARSDIKPDGTYEILDAPACAVKVSIYTPPNPPSPMRPQALPGFQNDIVVTVPRRYYDPETSGLSFTVSKGIQEHVFELKP